MSELEDLESSESGRAVLATCPPDLLRVPKLFPANRVPHSSTGDSMMNTTFHTEETFPVCVSYYTPHTVSGPEYPLGVFTMLLTIGSGLNGHPHKLHGGALSMILDEAMGRASRHHCTDGTVAFTATMTVDYKKPVSTPGDLIVKSWLEGRSDGRKHWVRAVVEQGDQVVAEGSCLFLEVPRPKEYTKSLM